MEYETTISSEMLPIVVENKDAFLHCNCPQRAQI